MTNSQALQAILSQCKPYVGIMPRSTFRSELKAISDGSATPRSTLRFFERFGYTGGWNDWQEPEKEEKKIVVL